MKIYELNLSNRYSNNYDKFYYIDKAKAEAELAMVKAKYEEAKAIGWNGLHWASITYTGGKIKELHTED